MTDSFSLRLKGLSNQIDGYYSFVAQDLITIQANTASNSNKQYICFCLSDFLYQTKQKVLQQTHS